MPSSKQIFISHSSKDDKIANDICCLLENNGFKCTIDHRDFRPGKDFDQEILDGIDNSSAFLLLLSGSSNESFQVKREVQYAADCGRGDWIFPVRIENVEPSRNLKFFLSLKHWTDAFDGPIENQLDELVNSLSDFMKIEKPAKDLFYTHYQKALRYKKEDTEVSIQYLEKAADGLCRKIYTSLNLGDSQAAEKMQRETIVKAISDSKKLPGQILIPLGIIQSFSNYINSGTEEGAKFLTEDFIAPSLDALTTILNWYYHDFVKTFREIETENPVKKYDIVLCCSKDDTEWTEENIFKLLINSENAGKSKPKINFLSANNLNDGNRNVSEILEEIKASKQTVFVLSPAFFRDNVGKGILNETIQLVGQDDRLLILFHPALNEKEIPIPLLNISSLSCNAANWTNKLAEKLKITLVKSNSELKLEFAEKISNVQVNKTIPLIKVIAKSSSYDECEIEISSNKPGLYGTLCKNTKKGIAEFDDLYFLSEAQNALLTASSKGFNKAVSNQFNVTSGCESVSDLEIKLPEAFSEIKIFSKGEKAVMSNDKNVFIVELNKKTFNTLKIENPLKFAEYYSAGIVAVEWNGTIHLVKDNNEHAIIQPPDNEFVYNIPVNIIEYKNELYISYYNGRVYRLANNNPELIFSHNTGLHHFSIIDDMFVVYDVEGRINSYKGTELVNSVQVENNILGCYSTSVSLIIILENKLYYYSPLKNTIITEKSGLDIHKSVYFGKNFFSLADTKGNVVLMDYDFVKLRLFSTVEGARVLFTNETKEFSVLRYPNNTWVLVKSNKVIFSSSTGPIMPGFQGELLLIGNGNKLNIHNKQYIEKISQS